MPAVSSSIRISPDGQYIMATGTYKPRVKCYEVNNLSIKFERCFDSEVTTFEILSDDYSKVVFLQCDRYIEIHAAHGRHYRLRIPRFGRDMSFHLPSCDLFLVGASPDIYRLNLERGQFLAPYTTESCGINSLKINPEHHLLCIGTEEGTIEAWDPRSRTRCGVLDVAMKLDSSKQIPSISTISFENGINMAVGTVTGQILLYDIRANNPILIKDHYNDMPIKRIEFNTNQKSVYSMDGGIFKIWDSLTGKQTAFIESPSIFNDFAIIPDTGMIFFTQEDVKMLTYYIPAMGPAPRWCSFLDNLTEEIESEEVQDIYDDYKFLTVQELGELGLDHLIGTDLLRAYMHGYFVDMRLYNKAKSVIEPFTFSKYRKEKIKQQIDEQRPNRLQIKSKLPKVNQDIALKLMENDKLKKKQKTIGPSLLDDNRFKSLFENPDFEVDKNAEEYKLLTPVLSRLDKSRIKELKKEIKTIEKMAYEEEEGDEHKSSDDDLFSEKDEDYSSDDADNVQFTREMKKQYKEIQKNKKLENDESDDDDEQEDSKEDKKIIEIDTGNELKIKNIRKKINK